MKRIILFQYSHLLKLQTLFLAILIAFSTLSMQAKNDIATGDINAQIKKYLSDADALEKAGKDKKSAFVLEDIIPLAKEAGDEVVLENVYGRLITYYSNINKKNGVEKYTALYNAVKSKREIKELEQKNKQKDALIKKVIIEKDKTVKEKKLAEQDNEITHHKLAITKDSLSLMDLINREKESKINLLKKEKEVEELMLKKQELMLSEIQAKEQRDIIIIISLVVGMGILSVLAFFIYQNFRQKKLYSEQIENQLSTINHQHNKITNSINYAQRIQNAMLPVQNYLQHINAQSFVLFKPKDVVSGDFYWFYDINKQNAISEFEQLDQNGVFVPADKQKLLIAAVDCTGHGVPGAFMSLIGYNILNMIANKHIHEPDQILTELHKGVRSALQQYKNENNDGMDMSICLVDNERKVIEFAGAKNPLIVIRDGELETIKGDKHGIGGSQGPANKSFIKHTIQIDRPTTFYMLSDGYEDQFGGTDNRKFMIKNLKDMLLKIHKDPFDLQQRILDKTIEDWRGETSQIDDILLIGMKVG
jgi:serine phosphatase RsbU (regulator of sigma subunit)